MQRGLEKYRGLAYWFPCARFHSRNISVIIYILRLSHSSIAEEGFRAFMFRQKCFLVMQSHAGSNQTSISTENDHTHEKRHSRVEDGGRLSSTLWRQPGVFHSCSSEFASCDSTIKSQSGSAVGCGRERPFSRLHGAYPHTPFDYEMCNKCYDCTIR